jgi:hypothetical protein
MTGKMIAQFRPSTVYRLLVSGLLRTASHDGPGVRVAAPGGSGFRQPLPMRCRVSV